jgi:hypothetical protein
MTKKEYLALAEAKYDRLHALKDELDFYTYEQKLEQIVLELGREVFEANLGKKTRDHRKKTS